MNKQRRSFVQRRLPGIGVAVLAAALLVPGAVLAKDYGKPGTPVHLVIGYQPYYTQAWSACLLYTSDAADE